MAIRINNTIRRPIITEKSMVLTGTDVYAFDVDLKAPKGLIAQTIAAMFNVDVVSVRTIINPGKSKRVGKTAKYTKSGKTKKALVKIKKGQKIDLFTKDQ